MDFTSAPFLILITLFYLGLALIRWLVDAQKEIDVILSYIALCSLVLFGLWSPASLVVIIYVTVITVLWVQLFQNNKLTARPFFITAIILVVLPLLNFKYTGFIVSTLGLDLSVNNWLLPLGISFYVFTSIGVMADVFTGKERKKLSALELVLLISYWPHLAAGPILRSSFITDHKYSFKFKRNIPYGILFIAAGAGKKLLIADNLGAYVNYNLSQGIENMDAVTAALTMTGFGGQIYADFSGYSEMAIGFSLLIGLNIPVNFNFPYVAHSISEFWRRWHISLSTWFRDYIYIPLGGNRSGKLFIYFNILLVFTVSGIWHGSSLNFLYWGFIHGVLLIINRLYRQYIGINLGWFAWLLTFISVNIAWSFFRLETDAAIQINSIVFNLENWFKFELDSVFYVVPILVMLFLVYVDHKFKYYAINEKGTVEVFKKHSKPLTYFYAWALFTLAMFFSGERIPFIYFEF